MNTISRFLLGLFALLAAGAISVYCTQPSEGSNPSETPSSLLIRDVTILSPHSKVQLPGQDVLVQDGRIQSITAHIGYSVPVIATNAKILDGSGLYLTPGLMDAHAHITNVPGFDYAGSPREQKHPSLITAYHRQQPRSLLYHGVTQIVDPAPHGSYDYFASAPLRPDLFTCAVLPNFGGYPIMPIEDALQGFPYFIMDPTSGYNIHPAIKANASAHTPEKVLKAIRESGAICAKIFLEDGFGAASWWPIPEGDLLKRIAKAAKDNNILLYAHSNAIDMTQIALEGDVDILAHGLWNWQWPDHNGPAPLEEVLQSIAAEKRGYIPTFGVLDGLQQAASPDPLADKRLQAVTPPVLYKWYNGEEAQWFRRDLVADFGPKATPESVVESFGYSLNRARNALAYLDQLGHNFMLGSDYPGSPSVAKQPGLSTLQEMEMMYAAGLSLQKVFEAATINNARHFGLSDTYGSVEVGKKANLLLLRANPLEDIAAWNNIHTVILSGVPIPRDQLRAEEH